MLASSLASPALGSVVVVIVLGTALAVWIIVAVTRPLRVLSDEVATAAREGFSAAALAPATPAPSAHTDDEFGCAGTVGRLTDAGAHVRYLALSDCAASVPAGFPAAAGTASPVKLSKLSNPSARSTTFRLPTSRAPAALLV